MDVLGERLVDGFGAVGGLGDDVEVGLVVHDEPEAAPHDLVVVGDEDPRTRGSASGAVRRHGHLEPDLDSAASRPV